MNTLKVHEKQKELDAALAEITTTKKINEKEFFLLKKSVIAKSNLYEAKLKEYYEARFDEAKKKLGKEVYEFINESIKGLTKAIEEDAKLSTPSAKLQEAFGAAVRAMAPYANINELSTANQAKIDELSIKLNQATKNIKALEGKALVADLHTMVVSECAGYPIDKMALLYETVVKMSPKTLIEGKEALEAAKTALKEKEEEIAVAVKLEEAKLPVVEVVEPKNTERNKLKVIAESIKVAEKEIKETKELVKTTSALDYEVYVGN